VTALLGVAAGPECTCGAGDDRLHSITCMVVAATQPHAMVNDSGEVFYPDSEEDEAFFAEHHGARRLHPDDPTPTTGAPFDYEPPPGCVCHLREDIDWGDIHVPPRGGCPVHTPWAFPGYSLTQEGS
jgi:hypothetical protein